MSDDVRRTGERRRSMRRLGWGAGLLLLVTVSSCDPFVGRVCTDIGCFSGLQVDFDRPLAPGTVVRLDLATTPWVVTCGVEVDCSEGIFFQGLRTDWVAIVIVGESGEQRFEVRPEYEESMPNGPDCPPTCFHARVALVVA